MTENPETFKHINEISILQNFFRSYLSFFFMSIEGIQTNAKRITEDVLDILLQCQNNGFLSEINTHYKEVVKGGTLDFSARVFSQVIVDIVNDLDVIQTFSLNTAREVFDKYKVNSDVGTIQSSKEIQKFVLSILDMELKSATDPRLELFLSCSKKYYEPLIFNRIVESCQKYSDLSNIFRQIDVPIEAVKIKRVMDRDESLIRRSDVLTEVKKLDEDESVTQSRVLIGDEVESPEDVNSMEEIENFYTNQEMY